MSNKKLIGDIKAIMEENVLPVFNDDEIQMSTINGIIDKDELENQKQKFFSFSTKYTIDELITVKQHYPENGFSKVTMDAEFFILRKDDALKLLGLIEKLETNG